MRNFNVNVITESTTVRSRTNSLKDFHDKRQPIKTAQKLNKLEIYICECDFFLLSFVLTTDLSTEGEKADREIRERVRATTSSKKRGKEGEGRVGKTEQ